MIKPGDIVIDQGRPKIYKGIGVVVSITYSDYKGVYEISEDRPLIYWYQRKYFGPRYADNLKKIV